MKYSYWSCQSCAPSSPQSARSADAMTCWKSVWVMRVSSAGRLERETEIGWETAFAQIPSVVRAKLLLLGIPSAADHVDTISMDQVNRVITPSQNAPVIAWFLNKAQLAIPAYHPFGARLIGRVLVILQFAQHYNTFGNSYPTGDRFLAGPAVDIGP